MLWLFDEFDLNAKTKQTWHLITSTHVIQQLQHLFTIHQNKFTAAFEVQRAAQQPICAKFDSSQVNRAQANWDATNQRLINRTEADVYKPQRDDNTGSG